MAVTVRAYHAGLEEQVDQISHKAWVLFKYNKDYDYPMMSCVFNEQDELIALGYIRKGYDDDHDVMEVVMDVNERGAERISEVRIALYPALIEISQAIRNPNKRTKLVAWNDFHGCGEFRYDEEFAPFQTYYYAKLSLEKGYPEIQMPSGIEVRHHPMETIEERMKYTEVENHYLKGVVYRSVNMLEWMMAGPELHTIAAFDGDELVGSVMCWQTGAVDRFFVHPRWRNTGLGEYLLTKGFEYHLQKGRTEVDTLVHAKDEPTMRLLESMGYSFPVKLELYAMNMK
ncbi:GNAT family N-acetyltransferase [Paenibacillus albus]|nr:GNAT family N-acetyltransferase [Paenibacillus albus]